MSARQLPPMSVEQWCEHAALMLKRVQECVYACSHPQTAQEITDLLNRKPSGEPIVVVTKGELWP